MPDTPGEGEGYESLFEADGATATADPPKDNSEASSEIDWDSDDNPWKQRAKGFQSDASKLRNELERNQGDVQRLDRIAAGLEDLNNRFDAVEDAVASGFDDVSTRSTGEFDDDDPDAQSQTPTNARTEAVRAAREERQQNAAKAEHAQLVQRQQARIAQLYREGMKDDPDVKRAAAMFNAAVNDPSKAADLYEAVEILRDVAPKYADSQPDETPTDTNPPSNEGTGESESQPDDADSDSGSDDEDEDDETPTRREALIDDPSTQGQTHSGISTGNDISNMKPLEMFERGLAGETPPGQ